MISSVLLDGRHVIVCILLMFLSLTIEGQDSLTSKDLERFSFPFQLTEDGFVGLGADVLTEAISKSKVVMLGGHHGSKHELDFASSLINLLDQSSFNKMILEIGPATADVLSGMLKENNNATEVLKAINAQYALKSNSLNYPPIPDLRSVEAAQMIQNAIDHEWRIEAIGTESWTGYKMVSDLLYQNLTVENKEYYKDLYHQVSLLFDSLYSEVDKENNEELLKLTTALKESTVFSDYLDKLSLFPNNIDAVNSLRFSIEHRWMYGRKEFFKKNKVNAKHNKQLLSKLLNSMDFDFKNDKLFVQMWRQHLAKGTTANGFYGVGNMLSELAAYHDGESLNIAFLRRYHKNGDYIIDGAIEPDYFSKPMKQFASLGKQDQWVLIDLRPFNEVYNWGPYKISSMTKTISKRYDMIVIPKMDIAAIRNE